MKIFRFLLVLCIAFAWFTNVTAASINHGSTKYGHYTQVDTIRHKMDEFGLSTVWCRFHMWNGYRDVWDSYRTTEYYLCFFCNRTQKTDKFMVDKKRNIVVQVGNQTHTLSNSEYKVYNDKGYVFKSAELSGYCLDAILNELKQRGDSAIICFRIPLANGNTYYFYPTKEEISEFLQGLSAFYSKIG